MNGKTELVVSPVIDAVLPKWDIADGKVEKVSAVCCLKARDSDIGLRIELLCDPAGDAVQLNAIQLSSRHAVEK